MEKNFLKIQILSIFVGISLALDYVTERPSYLRECEIKKPGFSKCATEGMQGMLDQLLIGIPTLKSFPAVDPFKLSKVKISYEGDSALRFKAEMRNVIVRGLRKAIVKNMKVSQKDYSWKAEINLPYASLKSDYAAKGELLFLPVNSNGRGYGEAENIDIIIEGKTKLYKKGVFTFAKVTGVKLDYIISELKFEIQNLFNGNKELEDRTNVFLNDNWRSFAEILKPVIQETASEIFLGLIDKLFSHFPAQFFITDIPTPSELYG